MLLFREGGSEIEEVERYFHNSFIDFNYRDLNPGKIYLNFPSGNFCNVYYSTIINK